MARKKIAPTALVDHWQKYWQTTQNQHLSSWQVAGAIASSTTLNPFALSQAAIRMYIDPQYRLDHNLRGRRWYAARSAQQRENSCDHQKQYKAQWLETRLVADPEFKRRYERAYRRLTRQSDRYVGIAAEFSATSPITLGKVASIWAPHLEGIVFSEKRIEKTLRIYQDRVNPRTSEICPGLWSIIAQSS